MKGLSLGLVVLGIWRYGVATSALAAAQPLVAVARDVGLSALDVVLPAKSWFLRQAAGLGGAAVSWPQEGV